MSHFPLDLDRVKELLHRHPAPYLMSSGIWWSFCFTSIYGYRFWSTQQGDKFTVFTKVEIPAVTTLKYNVSQVFTKVSFLVNHKLNSTINSNRLVGYKGLSTWICLATMRMEKVIQTYSDPNGGERWWWIPWDRIPKTSPFTNPRYTCNPIHVESCPKHCDNGIDGILSK